MIGKIYINGQIGAVDGEVGVNLIDVIKQVKAQPQATSFDVLINSEGGYVDVGFDIYDYLHSLKKSGMAINTVGIGLVASIATVIFMAGDTRKLKSGAQFMIHLPSGEVGGTADEISSYSQMLKDTENQLVKFYTNATGLSEEAIRPLLRNETWLSSEDAQSMGFVTEQSIELQAVAKFSNTNNNKMNTEDKAWIEKQLEKFTAMFGSKPKNIVLLDSNGAEITFPKVEEGQTPAIGDEATVDGQPADGEYIMPQLNNAKVIFAGGVITEIVEAESDDEMATLKAENERLAQELANAQANVETATAKATEVETKLSTIETEFTNFKAQVTAKFEVGKEERKEKKEEGVKNLASDRLAKLKETKKNK